MQKKITNRQKVYVEEVVSGKTEAEAKKKAGYIQKHFSPRRSKVVERELSARQLQVKAKTNYTAEKVLSSFDEIYQNCTSSDKYDSAGACRAMENIAKIIGAYKQQDTNNIYIANFFQEIQNKYGMIEAR